LEKPARRSPNRARRFVAARHRPERPHRPRLLDGASLDFTWEAQAEPATPDAARDLYERICQAAFSACRDAGGSVAHHYGVGLARADAWQAERGEAGLLAWRRIKAALDPNNILNPGKLGL
jgi:alkyldihydroxyacetonephosphate synthase